MKDKVRKEQDQLGPAVRLGPAAFQAASTVPNSLHFHFKERTLEIFLSRCKETIITKFN